MQIVEQPYLRNILLGEGNKIVFCFKFCDHSIKVGNYFDTKGDAPL